MRKGQIKNIKITAGDLDQNDLGLLAFVRDKNILFNEKLMKGRFIDMVFISFVVLILAIAGVALGICSIGVAIVFGDTIIGITLLVAIIKKLFFKKKKDDEK